MYTYPDHRLMVGHPSASIAQVFLFADHYAYFSISGLPGEDHISAMLVITIDRLFEMVYLSLMHDNQVIADPAFVSESSIAIDLIPLLRNLSLTNVPIR
jgi:hypothetical protein